MDNPIITIIHPTARVSPSQAFPEGWREVCRAARETCAHPERVEYLLCVHMSRDMELHATAEEWEGWGHFEVIRYDGAATGVRGANVGAEKARGEVYVILQDDMFPPQDWDRLLLSTLPAPCIRQKEFVVHVSSASPSGELPPRNDTLFNPQIITAARVKRMGYLGWPGYTTMFVDDEFSEHARRDGCVIDARHIVFTHRHPIFGEKWDAVYEDENKREAYRVGESLYKARSAAGFPGLDGSKWIKHADDCDCGTCGPGHRHVLVTPVLSVKSRVQPDQQAEAVLVQQQERRIIGICTPGEWFSVYWVDHWERLFRHLLETGWGIHSRRGYSTAVHVARASMAGSILQALPKCDFILWIDDDNLLTVGHFEMLVADLESAEKTDPAVGMVVAWCPMKCEDNGNELRVSCGLVDSVAGHVSVPHEALMDVPHDLVQVDWSGFPVVLMRPWALEKAGGDKSFVPIVDETTPWGCLYEDMAFCKRYKEAGGKILVDRRVRVPHLKLQPAEPRGLPTTRVSKTVEDGKVSYEVGPVESGR